MLNRIKERVVVTDCLTMVNGKERAVVIEYPINE